MYDHSTLHSESLMYSYLSDHTCFNTLISQNLLGTQLTTVNL